MALPFLKQIDITCLVNILHHLHHFPGHGALRVVNPGLGIARGEMAAVLHSYFWHKIGSELYLLLSSDKTLIQHFVWTTDWSARGAVTCPAIFQ